MLFIKRNVRASLEGKQIRGFEVHSDGSVNL